MSIILKKKIFIISVILFLSAFFLYTRHIIISHRNIPIVDVTYCARGDIEIKQAEFQLKQAKANLQSAKTNLYKN